MGAATSQNVIWTISFVVSNAYFVLDNHLISVFNENKYIGCLQISVKLQEIASWVKTGIKVGKKMVLLEHRAFIKKSFDSQKLSKIVMETTRIYSIFPGVLPRPPYLWGPTLPPVCLPPN